MRNPVYCIACEREVIPQNSTIGDVHEYEYRTEYGVYEYDVCEFPFGYAYCPPPPELEEDWELHLIEPEEELEEECILSLW